MAANSTEKIEEHLTLPSRLSEMTRVPVWIKALAERHAIPADTQYAIELCLEEALANIILHGYGSEPDREVLMRFSLPREGCYVFEIEDEAPQFNPLEKTDMPALNPQQDTPYVGQGIRLLRRFASELEYEQRPKGNRLRISFFPR